MVVSGFIVAQTKHRANSRYPERSGGINRQCSAISGGGGWGLWPTFTGIPPDFMKNSFIYLTKEAYKYLFSKSGGTPPYFINYSILVIFVNSLSSVLSSALFFISMLFSFNVFSLMTRRTGHPIKSASENFSPAV